MSYNDNVKLQAAFRVVLREFENYKKNLADKTLCVIYRNRQTKSLDYITIEFLGSNFYHLTGLVYKEDKGDKSKAMHYGSKFYSALSDKKLSSTELKIKDNNTQLKIDALPTVTSQYRYSKMTGDYNESGMELRLDKVIGGANTCLGLRKIGYKKYAPASSLSGDTRKYAKDAHQVVAIFIKETKDDAPFKTLKYVAKGHNLNNLKYSDEMRQLFTLENYKEPKNL